MALSIGWQIKRQSTPLSHDTICQIPEALRDQQDLATGHIAVEHLVSVQRIGEIRHLRELCDTLRRPGADAAAVCADADAGERTWLALLDDIAGDGSAVLFMIFLS